ncbi:diaminobutyrate acetyltransferase [Phenylobacterium sp.]|uniref:diaminobutyrate acetyltransferase n=1 Tax=Phenylobacterium sp. TaxID=1871053 RepID=UPI002FDB5BA9
MKLESYQSKAGAGPVIEDGSGRDLDFSAPVAEDGPWVHALVAACPPLDQNSVYFNLIQCTHFADTCVAVRRGDRLVGWVSGHVPPAEPDVLFIWQVAVAQEARGLGLGKRMIAHLLRRPAAKGARIIKTTITPDNPPSWGLFRSLAKDLGAPMEDHPWFLGGVHLAAGHAPEHLVTIGPFEGPARPTLFTDPTQREG